MLLRHPLPDAKNFHSKTFLGHKQLIFLKLNSDIKRVIGYCEKCKEINGETENLFRGEAILPSSNYLYMIVVAS